jgi:hypothetical protein
MIERLAATMYTRVQFFMSRAHLPHPHNANNPAPIRLAQTDGLGELSRAQLLEANTADNLVSVRLALLPSFSSVACSTT